MANIPNAILFIDEIHTIIGAGATSGGVMDASNLLKPVLEKKVLSLLVQQLLKNIELFLNKIELYPEDFKKVDLVEPSVQETIKILEGLKKKYEQHHELKYSKAS